MLSPLTSGIISGIFELWQLVPLILLALVIIAWVMYRRKQM